MQNKFSFRPQSRAGQMAQLFHQLKNDSHSHLPDSCAEKHAEKLEK